MSQGLCFFDGAQRLIVCNNRYVEMYQLDPAVVVPGITLREIVDLRFAAGTFPDMSADDYLKWRNAIDGLRQAVGHGGEIAGRPHLPDPPSPDGGGGWVATHEDITEREIALETSKRVLARAGGAESAPA